MQLVEEATVKEYCQGLIDKGLLIGGNIVSVCANPDARRGAFRSVISSAELCQVEFEGAKVWVLRIICSKTFRQKADKLVQVPVQKYTLPLNNGICYEPDGDTYIMQCKYATVCMIIPNTNKDDLIPSD